MNKALACCRSSVGFQSTEESALASLVNPSQLESLSLRSLQLLSGYSQALTCSSPLSLPGLRLAWHISTGSSGRRSPLPEAVVLTRCSLSLGLWLGAPIEEFHPLSLHLHDHKLVVSFDFPA